VLDVQDVVFQTSDSEQLARQSFLLFPKRFWFELISETTVSYLEILNLYKGWIAKERSKISLAAL